MPKFIFADTLEVPPVAKDIRVFDTELPGFGCKFESGRFVKYSIGTQQRRKPLGKVVRGNLKAMRVQAAEILAKARLSIDTAALARAAASKQLVSLGRVVDLYLKPAKASCGSRATLKSSAS